MAGVAVGVKAKSDNASPQFFKGESSLSVQAPVTITHHLNPGQFPLIPPVSSFDIWMKI